MAFLGGLAWPLYEVTMSLTEPYQWLRHHIYCDNLFSSVYLVETLLARQTYYCGTFRRNMRGLPEALKRNLKLRQGESAKWQSGNLVATVWHDRRDVRVISSNADPTEDVLFTREAPRNNHLVSVTV